MFIINVTAKKNRVNNEITAIELRLIDDKGSQLGVQSLGFSLRLASERGLDLVEIQPNANPPVAKIMNYSKFLFKKDKLSRKKKTIVKMKEVKFRPTTDKHDYELKIRNLRNFLIKGNKVKITIWFKGREFLHKELGKVLMNNIYTDLKDFGKVETLPKNEGKSIVTILIPVTLKESAELSCV